MRRPPLPCWTRCAQGVPATGWECLPQGEDACHGAWIVNHRAWMPAMRRLWPIGYACRLVQAV